MRISTLFDDGDKIYRLMNVPPDVKKPIIAQLPDGESHVRLTFGITNPNEGTEMLHVTDATRLATALPETIETPFLAIFVRDKKPQTS